MTLSEVLKQGEALVSSVSPSSESITLFLDSLASFSCNDVFRLLLYLVQRPLCHPLATNALFHKICHLAKTNTYPHSFLAHALSSLGTLLDDLILDITTSHQNGQCIDNLAKLLRFYLCRSFDLTQILLTHPNYHPETVLSFRNTLCTVLQLNSEINNHQISQTLSKIVCQLASYSSFVKVIVNGNKGPGTSSIPGSRLLIELLIEFNQSDSIVDPLFSILSSDFGKSSFELVYTKGIQLASKNLTIFKRVLANTFHQDFKISLTSSYIIGQVCRRSSDLALLVFKYLVQNQRSWSVQIKICQSVMISFILESIADIPREINWFSRQFCEVLANSLYLINSPLTSNNQALLKVSKIAESLKNQNLLKACSIHLHNSPEEYLENVSNLELSEAIRITGLTLNLSTSVDQYLEHLQRIYTKLLSQNNNNLIIWTTIDSVTRLIKSTTLNSSNISSLIPKEFHAKIVEIIRNSSEIIDEYETELLDKETMLFK
ncbi:hypothetical protein GEMRC1_004463 [Eukaryota sp. GEM-RC1]